jgi:hypothetical protein
MLLIDRGGGGGGRGGAGSEEERRGAEERRVGGGGWGTAPSHVPRGASGGRRVQPGRGRDPPGRYAAEPAAAAGPSQPRTTSRGSSRGAEG